MGPCSLFVLSGREGGTEREGGLHSRYKEGGAPYLRAVEPPPSASQEGGVPRIVELLRSKDPSVAIAAACAVERLSLTPESKAALALHSTVEALVAMLSRHGPEGGVDAARLAAGRALEGLAMEDGVNKMRIEAAGGIGPLVAVLADGDEKSQAAAAKVSYPSPLPCPLSLPLSPWESTPLPLCLTVYVHHTDLCPASSLSYGMSHFLPSMCCTSLRPFASSLLLPLVHSTPLRHVCHPSPAHLSRALPIPPAAGPRCPRAGRESSKQHICRGGSASFGGHVGSKG